MLTHAVGAQDLQLDYQVANKLSVVIDLLRALDHVYELALNLAQFLDGLNEFAGRHERFSGQDFDLEALAQRSLFCLKEVR